MILRSPCPPTYAEPSLHLYRGLGYKDGKGNETESGFGVAGRSVVGVVFDLYFIKIKEA